MSVFKLLFLSLLLGLARQTPAQTNDVIEAGRPGVAIGSHVVGNFVFQIETGISEAWAAGSRTADSTQVNNLFRYGLSENLELDSVINGQRDLYDSQGLRNDHGGLSDLQVGFTSNFIPKSHGFVPNLGLRTLFRIPSSALNPAYQLEQMAPILILSATYSLSEKLSFTENFSSTYDGLTAVPTYSFISAMGRSLSDTWACQGEFYVNSRNNKGSLYGDVGVAYLISKDLQADLSGGYGYNEGARETFLSLGISWRKISLKGESK